VITTLLLTLGLSWADGLHTGVPVTGIEGLGKPTFQTSQTGWSAVVEDGFVRVYVGRTEGAAHAWVLDRKKALRKQDPTANPGLLALSGVSDVHGDGKKLILFRDGNVAICVRHKHEGALPWAQLVHESIVDDGPPWPKSGKLVQMGSTWQVDPPSGTVHIAFEGGELASNQGLVFLVPPTALIVYDSWGRSVRTETQVTTP